jgi:hypothetical protein
MRPRTIILVVLLAFFALSHLYPNALLLIILFTFGLGFPLLLLNTVLLYFVAALPAVVAFRSVPRNWAMIGLAACVVPVVAFGPPFLSERLAIARAERLLAGDVAGTFAETPRLVEIVAYQPGVTGGYLPLVHTPCDELCQRLLLSGEVELVRVTRGFYPNPKPRQGQYDYVIERRDSCPDAFDRDRMLPETKDAIASGTCFVPRASDSTKVTARITVTEKSARNPRNLMEDIAAASGILRTVRTLEIHAASGETGSLKLRRTQVDYSYWTAPFHLYYAHCGGMCMGRPVFGRTQRTLGAFDTVAVALRALRLDGRPRQAPLAPADRVIAMLDHASESFTSNQEQLITDWTTGLRGGGTQAVAFSEKDAQLILRLAQDRRLTNFVFVAEVIARHRNLLRDNLDLFLDEMEARGADSEFSNRIGAIIPNLHLADIMPRRDRILALIRGNEWKWSRGIGILSGRLGTDTTALIAERLRLPASAETAALAACLADEPIGRAVVPDLIAYLGRLPITNRFPDNASRTVVKALARFGEFDAARELFLARFPKSGAHSLPRQSAADVVTDVNACLRG